MADNVGILVEVGDEGIAQWDPAVHDNEPGLAVLVPNFVWVISREKHGNVKGEEDGGRVLDAVGGQGRFGGVDAHVLDAN